MLMIVLYLLMELRIIWKRLWPSFHPMQLFHDRKLISPKVISRSITLFSLEGILLIKLQVSLNLNFLFLYLGAPISYKKLFGNDFNFLLEKITKKVAGWKGKLLFAGGKLTLIRAILSSISIHILSILKPPRQIITSLESFFNHFSGALVIVFRKRVGLVGAKLLNLLMNED